VSLNIGNGMLPLKFQVMLRIQDLCSAYFTKFRPPVKPRLGAGIV